MKNLKIDDETFSDPLRRQRSPGKRKKTINAIPTKEWNFSEILKRNNPNELKWAVIYEYARNSDRAQSFIQLNKSLELLDPANDEAELDSAFKKLQCYWNRGWYNECSSFLNLVAENKQLPWTEIGTLKREAFLHDARHILSVAPSAAVEEGKIVDLNGKNRHIYGPDAAGKCRDIVVLAIRRHRSKTKIRKAFMSWLRKSKIPNVCEDDSRGETSPREHLENLAVKRLLDVGISFDTALPNLQKVYPTRRFRKITYKSFLKIRTLARKKSELLFPPLAQNAV